jgi:hypothetical protein
MNQPARAVEPEVPEQPLSDEEIFAQEVERRSGDEPEDTATPLPAAAVETPLPEAKPEPEPEPTAEAAAASPQPVVEDEKPAWYADLDDEAKKAFDEQNNSLTEVREQFTALHGRLAPMQQQNERLREQVEHAGQRPQPTTPNSSATRGQQPGQAQPATAPTPALDLGNVPEFAEFQEAFPEQAKAMQALFGRQAQHASDLQSQLGTVSQGLEEIQQASFGQQREQGLNTLAAAHPDWMQVRPSEDFGNWLQTQPPSVSRMADSQDANECIYVIDRYKQDKWTQRQLDQPNTPQPEPEPATQTVRQRRQQIRSTPSLEPQGSGMGVPLGDASANMSDEDIFFEEVERRLRAQRNNR